MEHGEVDGIPTRWIRPDGEPTGVALWLPPLGGSAEQQEPTLARLAAGGRLAVSFDPPGQGGRATRPAREHAMWVLDSFRRRMWPLLGRTTLECRRVLDWVDATFGTPGSRVAGGLSVGGDIAVALAGIDGRISRVAALVATPDWTRPGMRSLGDRPEIIDQGPADSYAQWFYDNFNPMTHIQRYERSLAILFGCGAQDQHVPAEGALRFQAALPDRVTVDVHPGLSHMDGGRDGRLADRAVAWLTDPA